MSDRSNWSRDEIGEYHDDHGNCITKERDGWVVLSLRPDGRGVRESEPFKTLGKAMESVRGVS